LGVPLPWDYTLLISHYGVGSFLDFVGPLVPMCNNPYLDLMIVGRVRCEQFRMDKLRGLRLPKYPVWPEADGMVLWGVTDNGDELYYSRDSEFNVTKTVISYAPRPGEWCAHNVTILGYLSGLIDRSIVVDIFPDDLPVDEGARFLRRDFTIG
jgi:hypothetical protein